MIGVLSAYLRTLRVQIAALLFFLCAGTLTQVPLFNYLGYEFSALMTIPTAIIAGTLTMLWLRDHRKLPLTRRSWLMIIGDYLIVNLILLLIPFLVISLNAFSVKNCAFAKGILYYLLLPVITMIFSVSLALVVGTVFRRAVLVFYGVVGILLFHILLITYTQPQLFAYNFILGFFPGITYDETLTDISPLVLYRLFTILASLMLFAIFVILLKHGSSSDGLFRTIRNVIRNTKNDRALVSIIVLCGTILAAAHIFRDEMGFEFSAKDIQQRLGRRTESTHFIVYYQQDDYSADAMRRIKAEAEFHYRKVSERLNTKDTRSEKIELYIYPNGDWKHRYIGTTNTNIAKPWKREIHITSATFGTTFRHELVHILAAEFGYPMIRASLRMGMNEGLAVAVDWDEGIFTPHQYAAAINSVGELENVERLFTVTGFASQNSSYAYLVAGSFIRYLIDRYGIERVRRAFPNGGFMSSFGESLESLIKDWKAFLNSVDDSDLPPETVRSLFFQQSIFYKTCAREVADQNVKGMQAIREKKYSEAEQLFAASFANAPSAYALRGLFQSLNAQQKQSDVVRIFSDVPEQSTLRNNPGILLLLGDAFMLDRQFSRASALYDSIRRMNYSEAFIEAAIVRKQCILDSLDQPTFLSLYYGGMNDSARALFVQQVQKKYNRSPVLIYQHAVLNRMDTVQAAEQLLAAARTLLPMELQYFAFVRAGWRLYTLNKFEEAKSAFWQAKNMAPTETIIKRLDEQIDLCDFVALEMI